MLIFVRVCDNMTPTGWPHCEGDCSNNNGKYDTPIFSYPHKVNGKCNNMCIIGGVVLRNQHWPDAYYGAYFYGDFSTHELSYITFQSDGSEKVNSSTLMDKNGIKNPISVTTDPKVLDSSCNYAALFRGLH